MQRIHKQAIVSYSAEDMYHLVNDVEQYPTFVPWCREVEIVKQAAFEKIVRLFFSAKGLQQGFTTHNKLEPGTRIEMELVDGPFDELFGYWQFDSLAAGGCQISFELQFKFENTWLAKLFTGAFINVTNELVECFCQQAKQVYGK